LKEEEGTGCGTRRSLEGRAHAPSRQDERAGWGGVLASLPVFESRGGSLHLPLCQNVQPCKAPRAMRGQHHLHASLGLRAWIRSGIEVDQFAQLAGLTDGVAMTCPELDSLHGVSLLGAKDTVLTH
jgi:hypothetical protein